MLGEVVGQVEFAGGPEEIELFLVDSVFHPPVAHVEGFGYFLAHFGVEDAVGSFVIGFERGAGCWLFVAEFFEHGKDGAGVFAAEVDTACFGFGC